MSTAAYTPTVWVNNTAPELAAGNLNHAELGIKAATDGVRALESVLVECEVYADNAQTSAIASAASASASEVSAVSAEASAVTAKEEADRAAAVSGVDIATKSVAGLIKASSEIVVGIDGAPTLKQTDTSGLVGTAGLSATLQSLINYIADAVKTKLVKISDLANNLTTTSSGLALDARQGKVLNDSLNAVLTESGITYNGTYITSHTGGYCKIGNTVYINIKLVCTSSVSTTSATLTPIATGFPVETGVDYSNLCAIVAGLNFPQALAIIDGGTLQVASSISSPVLHISGTYKTI